jgi:SOS-response transcriptional repressor LexA
MTGTFVGSDVSGGFMGWSAYIAVNEYGANIFRIFLGVKGIFGIVIHMTPGTAIRAARKAKGMTQVELAEALGISQSHLSEMEAGRRTVTDEVLADAKKILGPLKYDAPDTPRNEVRPIVSRGNAVVPLYRTRVRAGNNAPVVLEDTEEQFDVAAHYENTCVYEVSGDSMIEAGIEEGDRLIVKLGYLFKPSGDVVLCRYNGQLMVKGARIIDGIIWLFPAHPHMHPWPCKPSDEFHCIGVVEEIIRRPSRDWIKRIDIRKYKQEVPWAE